MARRDGMHIFIGANEILWFVARPRLRTRQNLLRDEAIYPVGDSARQCNAVDNRRQIFARFVATRFEITKLDRRPLPKIGRLKPHASGPVIRAGLEHHLGLEVPYRYGSKMRNTHRASSCGWTTAAANTTC